jgi:hypothetical protein
LKRLVGGLRADARIGSAGPALSEMESHPSDPFMRAWSRLAATFMIGLTAAILTPASSQANVLSIEYDPATVRGLQEVSYRYRRYRSVYRAPLRYDLTGSGSAGARRWRVWWSVFFKYENTQSLCDRGCSRGRRMFILLARNADDASGYFHLPTDRVVEIGTQVSV